MGLSCSCHCRVCASAVFLLGLARLALCRVVGCTLRLFIFGDGATDVFLRVRSHVDRRVELHPRQDKSLRYVQAHMSTLALRPRMPSRSLLTHVLTSRVFHLRAAGV